MPITLLQHAKVTNYGKTANFPVLPNEIIASHLNAQIISFRKPQQSAELDIIKNVHACYRFHRVRKNTDVVCYGIQTDSPLSPLLLWDIAHGLSVGQSLTLYESGGSSHFLLRDYFSAGLVVESQTEGRLTLRKHKPLIAEQDQGLDQWSFAIPVGPDDGELLNAVVERILALDVPEKEILLCGRPSDKFNYFDKVRIVGEDIPAPPVQICMKKNRLAQEAKYPNLCILHSRVYLPIQFMDAVRKFGDNYPITAFQCLFFDDHYNLLPRRYSDYGVMSQNNYNASIITNPADPKRGWSHFNNNIFHYTEQAQFNCAHPLLFSNKRYITGSLYIVKRSVWQACPQNESLVWSEFEDIEYCLRAETQGIPSRINPHAITQSLISRPLLIFGGYTPNEHVSSHTVKKVRSFLERFPLPRKAMIKLTEEQALAGLYRYQVKYVPTHLHERFNLTTVRNNKKRIKAIIQLIYLSQIPIGEKKFAEFMKDYEKWLICDALPYGYLYRLKNTLLTKDNDCARGMLSNNHLLINQLSMRPKGQVFCREEQDFILTESPLIKLSSFISACSIWRKRKSLIYVEGGPLSLYRLILGSTPFKSLK